MHDIQPERRWGIADIAGSEVIADLLSALCDVTGLGFAVIARVTEDSWMACAVVDRIQMGLAVGQRLDVTTTFCGDVRRTGKPIVMDHATADPQYCNHPAPKMYGFESYIAVPINFDNGDYVGNLCALDRRPSYISDPRIQLMFHCYAKLIAQHLDGRSSLQGTRPAPLDKNIVGNLRGLFDAMLAQTSPDRAEQAPAPGQISAELAPDPAVRQLAARVLNQQNRLCSLVNDVLVYARGRLNDGRSGYIWKVDDLHARLKAMVADTAAEHPDRTIITNISFDHPVDCDPGLIQELAATLLRNALAQGAPAGPVSFIVSTHDNDLEIAVWNEGNVISNQGLRNVFTPPLRRGADPSASRPGLHTCAQIVRAHLGTIGVTSSPTEGTQFVARIPVARSLRLH